MDLNIIRGSGVASGTDTYAATLSVGDGGLIDFGVYLIRFTNANTGASTLNINSIGAKSIKRADGSALQAGDIIAGSIIQLIYNSGTDEFIMTTSGLAGFLDLKGDIDASINPNYPAASKGDTYLITVAGKVGGGSGEDVEVGDMLIAKEDNVGGTEASVGTSWFVLEMNLHQATESAPGYAEIATQAEVDGLSDDQRYITPLKLFNSSLIQNVVTAWTDQSFNAGDYTAAGGGSWTVASGDVQRNRYKHVGRILFWQVSLTATTISGTVSSLTITLPNSLTVGVPLTNTQFAAVYFEDFTTPSNNAVLNGTALGTGVTISLLDYSNFPTGVDNFLVRLNVVLEVTT